MEGCNLHTISISAQCGACGLLPLPLTPREKTKEWGAAWICAELNQIQYFLVPAAGESNSTQGKAGKVPPGGGGFWCAPALLQAGIRKAFSPRLLVPCTCWCPRWAGFGQQNTGARPAVLRGQPAATGTKRAPSRSLQTQFTPLRGHLGHCQQGWTHGCSFQHMWASRHSFNHHPPPPKPPPVSTPITFSPVMILCISDIPSWLPGPEGPRLTASHRGAAPHH